MKKTVVMLLSVTALILFAPLYVRANSEITVKVNGNVVELDQSPIIIDEELLLPVRGVFEAMGFEDFWNDRTRTVHLVYKIERFVADDEMEHLTEHFTDDEIENMLRYNAEFTMTVGRYHFRRWGKAWDIDTPVQIIDDRAMFPLSALSAPFGIVNASAFGTDAAWDSEQKIAEIYMHSVPEGVQPIDISAYEPLTFFVVSATGEIEQMEATVAYRTGDIYEKWAELNGFTNTYVVNTYPSSLYVMISTVSIFDPMPEIFVLIVTHTNELETRINGEYGAALIESLERTLRGFLYFDNFIVNLR